MNIWRSFLSTVKYMTEYANNKPLVVILGATGTGKSKLAVDLALRCNGEIINGDAMQLYRGIPIITNKVTPEERQGIPHHLIDCIDVLEPPWTVSHFVRKATKIIRDIHDKGKLPILVGGTHYYLQGLLFRDSVIEDEPQNDNVKAKRALKLEEEELLNGPTDQILKKLEEVDPAMAERWHPKDRRRLQRSLEIWFKNGRRASEIYAEQADAKECNSHFDKRLLARYQLLMFWTYLDPQTLNDRLQARVDEMLKRGLLLEASQLYQFAKEQELKGLQIDKSRGIWISIGLKEFQDFIEQQNSGNCSEAHLTEKKAEAINRVKLSTYQYAKNQLRWIRTKFADGLRGSDLLDRLFLVDWTEHDSNETKIMDENLLVTTQFLNGMTLPNPVTLSPTAEEALGKLKDRTRIATKNISKRFCPQCEKTMLTAEEWEKHVNGHSHRRVLRKQSRIRSSPCISPVRDN